MKVFLIIYPELFPGQHKYSWVISWCTYFENCFFLSRNFHLFQFKRVLLDTKPATALNPIGTFGHNNLASSEQPDGQTQMASAQFYSVSSANSSSSNYNQPPVITEPKATVASEEVRLTDWVKMACLLCKRQFKDREALVKHQRMSDMHKVNIEINFRT